MFWELFATVVAGLGGAGIALLLRRLTKKRLPLWLAPVFAGIAMLAIQIEGEYDWYPHQVSLLPKGVVVVKAVEEKTLWRPWSYLFPQTVRFSAVDVANAATNKLHPNWILVDFYLFARHQPAQRMPQVIDCKNQARSDFFKSKGQSTVKWLPLSQDDPLLTTVCSNADAPNKQ